MIVQNNVRAIFQSCLKDVTNQKLKSNNNLQVRGQWTDSMTHPSKIYDPWAKTRPVIRFAL